MISFDLLLRNDDTLIATSDYGMSIWDNIITKIADPYIKQKSKERPNDSHSPVFKPWPLNLYLTFRRDKPINQRPPPICLWSQMVSTNKDSLKVMLLLFLIMMINLGISMITNDYTHFRSYLTQINFSTHNLTRLHHSFIIISSDWLISIRSRWRKLFEYTLWDQLPITLWLQRAANSRILLMVSYPWK